MKSHLFAALLVAASAAPALAQSAPAPLPPVDPRIATLRDAALRDDYAWDVVEGLTTEVGQRLAAVKALNEAGVPCHVAIAPVVPQITDHELEHIVEAAVEAGAPGGFYLPVRLPHEVAPLFRAWLDEHYPDRAGKVMATIRSLRGGRDNDPDFHSRMQGQGPWAELLRTRFEKAVKRYGLRQARFALRSDLFRPPEGEQMRLL
jgi:DNA repair photolyase